MSETVTEGGDHGVRQITADTPKKDFDELPAITPSSPSSKYTKSRLLDVDPSVSPFRGVVLAFWDNILGPRTRHVWNVDLDNMLKSDLLSHVSSQVLSCEICRDPLRCEIDFKFYNLPHKSVIVPAFLFSAQGKHGDAVHSLYVVIPSSALKFYLEIHETLQSCFQRLTSKFRILLEKNSFEISVDVFGKYLSDCLRALSRLHGNSLSLRVKMSDTAFSENHVLEQEFLARCVASHLMTFGRSLIIGETADRINLVLNTLAMFNSESERRCSLPLNVKDPQSYHHDLFLQGCIKKGDSNQYMPMTEILVSRYPTTIVDLTSRDVKQTHAYSEHVMHRFETLKNELICLQYGHFDDLVVLDQDLYSSSAYPDTIIKQFIREIFELPSTCCVREAAIQQLMRMLHKQAHCLIECVKVESYEGSVPIKAQTLKKIRQDLHLSAEGDFRIVLAMAEKLKPGIFCFLKAQKKGDWGDFAKTVEIL